MFDDLSLLDGDFVTQASIQHGAPILRANFAPVWAEYIPLALTGS